MIEPEAWICPRCSTICRHKLEIYFRWCPRCGEVTGTPRPCPHPPPVTEETWKSIRNNTDDCLIAIENWKPLPTKALQALPPWRAATLARVADACLVDLEDGTVEQLLAEARRVGGEGKLGNWWET